MILVGNTGEKPTTRRTFLRPTYMFTCEVEWRPSLAVSAVDIGAVLQQKRRDLRVAGLRRQAQRRAVMHVATRCGAR